MKLYVGLGNPGRSYENTRHNVGFSAVDTFAKETGLLFDQRKFKGKYGKIVLNDQEILVLKPQTYMNLSGEAVRDIASYYRIDPQDILVIYDDMDLPLGKIRLRKNGSGGGHNGMKNIIQLLSNSEIKRIRVGVGKNPNIEMKDYVLGKFTKEEKAVMKETYQTISSALIDYSKVDFDVLMNKYNASK